MMDCVLSGSLLVVFLLFCYAMCVFFEQINSLSSQWRNVGSRRPGAEAVSNDRPLGTPIRPFCAVHPPPMGVEGAWGPKVKCYAIK